MQNNKSAAIDVLRAISVLYIVGFWHLLNYVDVLPGYANALTYRFTVTVLGLFVFVSGYLSARGDLASSTADVAAFYKKKLLRIWPLYVIALSLFLLCDMTTAKTATLSAFGLSMLIGGPPMTLWFVSMLVVFYVVAPVLVASSRSTPVFLAVATSILFLFHFAQVDARLSLYFPAFVLGVYVSINRHIIDAIPITAVAAVAAGAILVSMLSTRPDMSIAGAGIGAVTPLLYLLIAERLVAGRETSRAIAAISYASFAMYLYHRPAYAALLLAAPLDPWHRLMYLVVICLPVIVATSYFAQKTFDTLVSKLRTYGAIELPVTKSAVLKMRCLISRGLLLSQLIAPLGR